MAGINVPIGPAKVEFGTTSPVIFDITKGGIQFQAATTKQDITVDQYGDTAVKSILKGRTAQVTVPFALHDLDKLAAVIPNSTLVTDALDTTKKKIVVKTEAGYDLTKDAKKLVVKPTDSSATANDYITIPLAVAIADIEYTYNSDNERIANVTFVAYPDIDNGGTLYILGDETAA
jgi:kynureninase